MPKSPRRDTELPSIDAAPKGRATSLIGGIIAALTVLWTVVSFLLAAGGFGTLLPWRIVCACAWALGCWAIAHYLRPPYGLLVPTVLSLAMVWGLYRIPPRADRNWSADHAHAPSATFKGDLVTVNHFRSFRYPGDAGVEPRWITQTFDLTQLEGCDFIVVPFAANPRLAHTMVSFRFAEGPNLALSVEARREEGEAYSVVRGLLHQFEIVYVVGDEEDLLGVRLERLRDTLFIHPVQVELSTCRQFLIDLLTAATGVSKRPQWYGTLRSNCTTNLVDSLERTGGKRIPWDARMLLPGGSAELVYDLGLLDSTQDFDALRKRARKAPGGEPRRDGVPFSTWIRAAE